MQDFLVHQKVTIWQAFNIKAKDADDAIAKVKANPTCSDLENDGIEYLYETETVLATALFNGDDSQDDVLFTHALPGYAQDLDDAALPMPDPHDQCERLVIAQVNRGWLGERLAKMLYYRSDFDACRQGREYMIMYGSLEEYLKETFDALDSPDPEERRKLEYLLAQTDVSYFQIIN